MKNLTLFRTGTAALALSVACAAPLLAADLTIAVQKVPDSLDPAIENSNVNQRIMYSLFETLVKVDYRDGGALKPGLATEWDIIDARTIEFRLKEGVTFHNGDNFDAYDVAATFSPGRLGQTSADGNSVVVTKPFLGGVESVEVVNPMTVRIRMADDDAVIVHRFANYPSQIVSNEAIEAAGSYADFAAHPVGTGPYRLESFRIGEKVVLEAFDDYHGADTAAADRVSFLTVPEISTRIAGLRSGQFDLITEVGPDQIAEIDSADGAKVLGGPVENIRGLIYDSTNDVLDDPRIREALNLAIDRELLVQTLYQGRTEVPQGWQMDIFGDMFLAERAQPAFDLARAKELVAASDYDGEEIVYRTQAEYYTNQGETAQILQAMWAQAGLNVKLEMKENWSQVTEDSPSRHIFDGSFTAYYPDPMGQFWRRFGPDGGWAQDNVYVVDLEMERLGHTLATSPDTQERREVFAEMLDKFETDPDGALLHMLSQFIGVNSERVDLRPMPTLYLDLTTRGVTFNTND
jgi:peptide/nickel transport system substrate-binding protein